MSPPIRLNKAQQEQRDRAVGELVHVTAGTIQLAYVALLRVGIDGPDLIIDYHWKDGSYPSFHRPNVLNVPLAACLVMKSADFLASLRPALAMYAAHVEYDQVMRAFNRAADIRTVRRPVKPTQNCEAYHRFLRVLRTA